MKWTAAIPACIGLLAALLLFTGLNTTWLWQDEANTAVLATRILRFGKPLAYDGLNLVGMDDFDANAPVDRLTANPQVALDYFIKRRDLKSDGSWKYHPWGQFLVAAASIALFGQTTLAARLPFVLAALLTVLLLYGLALRATRSRLIATTACLLLCANAYWILHSRQCRYYALSSLLLLATVVAYMRWQQGTRWGPAIYILVAACWFNVDYGTVFPVLAVLFADAFLFGRKPLQTAGTLISTATVLAPFIWFYELWTRSSPHGGTYLERLAGNLFNLNEYVAPVVLVVLAIILLFWHRKTLPQWEQMMIRLTCGILIVLALWVPLVAPLAFLRYVILAAPLGCLLAAWCFARLSPAAFPSATLAMAAILAFTPWLSAPFRSLAHPGVTGTFAYREELGRLASQVFGKPYDLNRETVEWLKANTSPDDQILINYEDLPLVYYLPNPIRGGIAAFRVEDESHGPPAVMILRRWVPFVPWEVYVREADRYQWDQVPLGLAAAMWGNNPDPMADLALDHNQTLLVARRREAGSRR